MVTQYPAMPAKHPFASRTVVVLGLASSLIACGPIAFQDTVNFSTPEPKPKLETKPEPEPKTETKREAKPARARISGDHIVIDDMVQFEYNSAEIKPESHGILDDVVKVMQDNPKIEKVDIIGHTSSEGSVKLNNKLSTDRAASVKQYLIDHGVDAGRLTSQGKGPSEPIADNATEEGRVANRRVEFKITNMAGESGARGRPGK